MKFHAERTNVERSGVATETTFRIKTTAKAFDILSSGLYTDTRLAIVRELSCNAYDAHVAAGRPDVPFEIHLPNRLEPWFHVRDFGTGLSDEAVMSLYTTYFESTKTDSNDFIGALGLGSKSPFSYTKAFEVTARHNGKRRIYSAFINEEGLPSIAKLGDFDTDEVNGLEVRITVQPEDFYMFAERTSQALRWFPVKPTIVGYPNFEFAKVPACRLEGTTWKAFESSFTRDHSKMTAVQGNVAYKVDVSKLEIPSGTSSMFDIMHLVGFFDIGELEVAANREEIRYDDRSKAALLAKIAQARTEIVRSVEEQIEAIEDRPTWDICVELNRIVSRMFLTRNHFANFCKDSTNGHIQNYLHLKSGELALPHIEGHELTAYEQSSSYNAPGKYGIKNRNVNSGVVPEPNVVIFYNDMTTGGVARVKEWVRTVKPGAGERKPIGIIIKPKTDHETIVFNQKDNTHTKRKWTEKDYAAELAAIKASLGDVTFRLASSDTPTPERAKTTQTGELPIYQFDSVKTRQYSQSTINWTKKSKIDLNAGGVYFHLQNGTHISFVKPGTDVLVNVSWIPEHVNDNIKIAVTLINKHLSTTFKHTDVYGFGSQAINKIRKNTKWINMFDVLREVVKTHEDALHFVNRLENTTECHGIFSACKSTTSQFVKNIDSLDVDSVLKTMVTPLLDDLKKFRLNGGIVPFLNKVSVDLEMGLKDNNRNKSYINGAKLLQTYPMLTLIDNIDRHSADQSKAFFEYISIIDRS